MRERNMIVSQRWLGSDTTAAIGRL